MDGHVSATNDDAAAEQPNMSAPAAAMAIDCAAEVRAFYAGSHGRHGGDKESGGDDDSDSDSDSDHDAALAKATQQVHALSIKTERERVTREMADHLGRKIGSTECTQQLQSDWEGQIDYMRCQGGNGNTPLTPFDIRMITKVGIREFCETQKLSKNVYHAVPFSGGEIANNKAVMLLESSGSRPWAMEIEHISVVGDVPPEQTITEGEVRFYDGSNNQNDYVATFRPSNALHGVVMWFCDARPFRVMHEPFHTCKGIVNLWNVDGEQRLLLPKYREYAHGHPKCGVLESFDANGVKCMRRWRVGRDHPLYGALDWVAPPPKIPFALTGAGSPSSAVPPINTEYDFGKQARDPTDIDSTQMFAHGVATGLSEKEIASKMSPHIWVRMFPKDHCLHDCRVWFVHGENRCTVVQDDKEFSYHDNGRCVVTFPESNKLRAGQIEVYYKQELERLEYKATHPDWGQVWTYKNGRAHEVIGIPTRKLGGGRDVQEALHRPKPGTTTPERVNIYSPESISLMLTNDQESWEDREKNYEAERYAYRQYTVPQSNLLDPTDDEEETPPEALSWYAKFMRCCVNVSDSQADAMMRAQCEVLKKGEGDAVPLRALSSPRPRDTTRATAPLSTDARKQRREKERQSARNLKKAIDAMRTEALTPLTPLNSTTFNLEYEALYLKLAPGSGVLEMLLFVENGVNGELPDAFHLASRLYTSRLSTVHTETCDKRFLSAFRPVGHPEAKQERELLENLSRKVDAKLRVWLQQDSASAAKKTAIKLKMDREVEKRKQAEAQSRARLKEEEQARLKKTQEDEKKRLEKARERRRELEEKEKQEADLAFKRQKELTLTKRLEKVKDWEKRVAKDADNAVRGPKANGGGKKRGSGKAPAKCTRSLEGERRHSDWVSDREKTHRQMVWQAEQAQAERTRENKEADARLQQVRQKHRARDWHVQMAEERRRQPPPAPTVADHLDKMLPPRASNESNESKGKEKAHAVSTISEDLVIVMGEPVHAVEETAHSY